MTMLFERYAAVLKTTCRRIIKDEAQANDVFQEGFISIFNKLESFKGKSSLYTWMNRIMLNTSLNQVKKANLLYTSLDINEMQEELANAVFTEENQSFYEQMDAKSALKLMKELPDKYRIVLNLYAVDGLKHQEISEELNISAALSRKIVSRARVKLLELIKIRQHENRRSGYAASK